MSRKSFETASRRAESGIGDDTPIEFELDGHVMTATPPTAGQLTLMLNASGKGGMESIKALFQFLANILPDEDYAKIEMALNNGVEIALISDIVTYLVGEWSGRPTKPASASASTQKPTGKQSTAKRVSKAAAKT